MSEAAAVASWNEAVGGRTDDDAATEVLARLSDAPWLAAIGRPSRRDTEVTRASSWTEALRMITEGVSRAHAPTHGTGRTGTLNAPLWLLIARLDADDALHRRTADAANHALATVVSSYYQAAAPFAADICPHLGADADALDAKAAIGDYIHEYIRLLFIEIYAGDVAEPRCTYFRDQLGWFLAGHLPCGWDGAWPVGRMRVF